MNRTIPRPDASLGRNDRIEKAILAYSANASDAQLVAVLEAIQAYMRREGRLLLPALAAEGDGKPLFCLLQADDGREWMAAFTSAGEHAKAPASQAVSLPIQEALDICAESGKCGIVINPWGQAFSLSMGLINLLLHENAVPNDKITPELLDGGTFLKRAVDICRRNPSQLNLLRLMKILRDSWVWIPCNAILSDADRAAMEALINHAEASGNPASIVGATLSNQSPIRMAPDILKNGDALFFPVFTSAEEMGDYGRRFSRLERHFLAAANLAKNNSRHVAGIVINAFTNPFVVPREIFATMSSDEFKKSDQDRLPFTAGQLEPALFPPCILRANEIQ